MARHNTIAVAVDIFLRILGGHETVFFNSAQSGKDRLSSTRSAPQNVIPVLMALVMVEGWP